VRRQLSASDDPQAILRVAIEAVCSEKTVKRWLADPNGVSPRSRIRIEQAIQRLGMGKP
jgi:DNA-binding LacI/PurR family transcriptional regulator